MWNKCEKTKHFENAFSKMWKKTAFQKCENNVENI